MKKHKFLFWQPEKDILRALLSINSGKYILVFFNYIIWIFLFYISYLIIKSNINAFWQLLFAVIVTEIVERYVKKKVYWRRPLFNRKDKTPPGLVDKWYKTGSFPSGHTIKAVYYLLFIIQYQVFDPISYIAIIVPLLFFRVLMGFHYPIDLLGGIIIGIFSWIFTRNIVFPDFINNFIQLIFNFIFLIH